MLLSARQVRVRPQSAIQFLRRFATEAAASKSKPNLQDLVYEKDKELSSPKEGVSQKSWFPRGKMGRRAQHLPKFRSKALPEDAGLPKNIWPWPRTPDSIHSAPDPRDISSDWLHSKNFNDGYGARVSNVINYNWKSQNAFDLKALQEFKGHIGRLDQSSFTVAAVFKAADGTDYCPGADLVTLYNEGLEYNREFYKTAQETCYYMATMRTPAFACIQGNTYGIGAGLTAHTDFRIQTESAIWSMPNTLYGAVPDCGMTYRLPRLDGDVGMFLALTGKRVETLDVSRVGLASHFIESNDLNRFCQETGKIIGEDHAATETFYIMLNKWIKDRPDDTDPSAILPHLPSINRCFNQRSLVDVRLTPQPRVFLEPKFGSSYDLLHRIVRACRRTVCALCNRPSQLIFEKLEEENTFWARNTLDRLKYQCSPLMLHVTFRLQRLGRYMYSLAEALELEYRVMQHVLESKDYWEGIKAHMIDKRKPVWEHQSIYDVREEEIAKFFEPTGHTLDLEGCEIGNTPNRDPFSSYNYHVEAEMGDPFREHLMDRSLDVLMPHKTRTPEQLISFYREIFRQGGMEDIGGQYYHKLSEYQKQQPDNLIMDELLNNNKDHDMMDLDRAELLEDGDSKITYDMERISPEVDFPFHQKEKL